MVKTTLKKKTSKEIIHRNRETALQFRFSEKDRWGMNDDSESITYDHQSPQMGLEPRFIKC